MGVSLGHEFVLYMVFLSRRCTTSDPRDRAPSKLHNTAVARTFRTFAHFANPNTKQSVPVCNGRAIRRNAPPSNKGGGLEYSHRVARGRRATRTTTRSLILGCTGTYMYP